MERKCAQCDTELHLGREVIGLQTRVIGPKGFVQLEDMEFVCNEECARRYFDDTDVVTMPRRIP